MDQTSKPAAKAQLAPFPSLDEFVFRLGLYSPVTLNILQLGDLAWSASKADGYCPDCGRDSTFTRTGNNAFGQMYHVLPEGSRMFWSSWACARDADHRVSVVVRTEGAQVQKVGQYPSLADIATDEARKYRGVLGKDDGAELHRAIGLAAHGVGIGSFVYLRRIFERLIQGRFEIHREQEGWSQVDFDRLRMDEKVAFLKDHLPSFLVEHRRMYSILSLGIHELGEKECLAFFPVLMESTALILEQDRIERERRDRQDRLRSAMAKFQPEAAAPKDASNSGTE